MCTGLWCYKELLVWGPHTVRTFSMTSTEPHVHNNCHFILHDSFAAVNTAAIVSKMTIAAVSQTCHRCR